MWDVFYLKKLLTLEKYGLTFSETRAPFLAELEEDQHISSLNLISLASKTGNSKTVCLALSKVSKCKSYF